MTADTRVVVARRIAAAPDRVFDAWLDPETARRFLFATPGGTIVRCDIDARVGGRFLIIDRRADGDAEHHGEFTAIERPRRLAFNFRGPGTEEGDWSHVMIAFEPDGDGTHVELTHDIPDRWAEFAGPVRDGWTKILGTLADSMENSNG